MANKEVVPSSRAGSTPNRGPSTDPNPGERSRMTAAAGAPRNSLGLIPARGNRAGGGQQIDIGAQVGIMRSLEFSAGGRSQRLSTGTYSTARPAYDPRSGIIHTSSASDTGGSPASGGSPIGGRSPQAAEQAGSVKGPQVEGAGDLNDTTTGDTSPQRRRDTRTP